MKKTEDALTSSKERALQALEAALTKNALQPVLMDVSQNSSYTNYILIFSGRSTRQVEAITEAIRQGMKGAGHEVLGVEGTRGAQWMLLDYSDVVVHVFYHPQRQFYDLEGLWSEAPRVPIVVPPELQYVDMDADEDEDEDEDDEDAEDFQ